MKTHFDLKTQGSAQTCKVREAGVQVSTGERQHNKYLPKSDGQSVSFIMTVGRRLNKQNCLKMSPWAVGICDLLFFFLIFYRDQNY